MRVTTIRIAQMTVVLAVLIAWIVAAATHRVNPLFLPAPATVGRSIVKLVASADFWPAIRTTVTSLAEAYAIAAVCGFVVGAMVGRSARLVRIIEPILSAVFAIPLTLFFPVFILLFGIGPGSKIAFGALYAFFPIALNTIAGFGGVDPLYLRSARSLGASTAQTIRHIYAPGALPLILTGLRIGFFICFASILGAETLASLSGIGHSIAYSAQLLDSGRMFAWIFVVISVTLVMNVTVSYAERRFNRA